MKIFWIAAILFKIFSKIENKIINRSCSRVNIIAPNYLQNFFSWYYFIFIFNQQFKQHSFLSAQLNFVATFRNGFLRFEINRIVSKTICVANRRFVLQLFIFLNQLLYTQYQLFQVKRFGQVI